jgi:hypothetical protein
MLDRRILSDMSKKITPPKPSQSIQVRLPLEIYQWLVARSEAESRSLNGQVVYMLRQAKEDDEAAAKDTTH